MRKEIYKSDLLNADLGYVELVDPKAYGFECFNENEESRIMLTTKIAAISAGKEEASNPEKRYKALMKEGVGETPSRPFEFIPCVFKVGLSSRTIAGKENIRLLAKLKNGNESIIVSGLELLKFTKHGFIDGEYFYTNARNVLKFMRKEDNTPDYQALPYYKDDEELKEIINKKFKVFKLRVPMFVFNHLVTHTQVSKVTKSDRVSGFKSNILWLPEDFHTRVLEAKKEELLSIVSYEGLVELLQSKDAEIISELFTDKLTQTQVREILKLLKYPKEIYQRAVMEMRYKDFALCGWMVEDSLINLLRERGAMEDKNWVQKETKQVALVLKELIDLDLN